MIYRGVVVTTDAAGVFVRVAALGSALAFGPVPCLDGVSVVAGDFVLVADCGGATSPDLIVIGVLS